MRTHPLAAILFAFALLLTPTARAQDAFSIWESRMLAGEYDAAATQAREIAQLHETSSVWAYRTAAALARAGDTDNAIAWLETAADRGYSGVRTIETDADIDAIRAHKRFRPAADRVLANAEKRMESFKAEALKADPIVRLPPGHDPAAETPLLIVLHGTGGTGRRTADEWRSAARRAGAILIAPDAVRPSGGGYAWVFRDESEWYIEHLIEDAKRAHTVGPVIVAGFSQGANIALAMGRSHPELFDGVIAVSGHWEDDVAEMPAKGDRPAWYLMIGERDPWVETYAGGEAALSGAGMEVEVRVVPRLGHQVPPSRELHAALAWCLERAGEE